MEAMMKRVIAITMLLLTAASAYACRPPYLEYEAVFEPHSARLSAAEVRRLADWRINTRRAFPAGFTVYAFLRQNDRLGISRQLAEARAWSLTSLLENLGISEKDIERPEIRPTAQGHIATAVEERFFNVATISINPRCPHACCER